LDPFAGEALTAGAVAGDAATGFGIEAGLVFSGAFLDSFFSSSLFLRVASFNSSAISTMSLATGAGAGDAATDFDIGAGLVFSGASLDPFVGEALTTGAGAGDAATGSGIGAGLFLAAFLAAFFGEALTTGTGAEDAAAGSGIGAGLVFLAAFLAAFFGGALTADATADGIATVAPVFAAASSFRKSAASFFSCLTCSESSFYKEEKMLVSVGDSPPYIWNSRPYPVLPFALPYALE
jgi:hypothetical protein